MFEFIKVIGNYPLTGFKDANIFLFNSNFITP